MEITTTGNNQIIIYPSYVLSVNSQDFKHYIFIEEYKRRSKIIYKIND
jgi:hypothetical protein